MVNDWGYWIRHSLRDWWEFVSTFLCKATLFLITDLRSTSLRRNHEVAGFGRDTDREFNCFKLLIHQREGPEFEGWYSLRTKKSRMNGEFLWQNNNRKKMSTSFLVITVYTWSHFIFFAVVHYSKAKPKVKWGRKGRHILLKHNQNI